MREDITQIDLITFYLCIFLSITVFVELIILCWIRILSIFNVCLFALLLCQLVYLSLVAWGVAIAHDPNLESGRRIGLVMCNCILEITYFFYCWYRCKKMVKQLNRILYRVMEYIAIAAPLIYVSQVVLMGISVFRPDAGILLFHTAYDAILLYVFYKFINRSNSSTKNDEEESCSKREGYASVTLKRSVTNGECAFRNIAAETSLLRFKIVAYYSTPACIITLMISISIIIVLVFKADPIVNLMNWVYYAAANVQLLLMMKMKVDLDRIGHRLSQGQPLVGEEGKR
ncbi:hypothetical protein BDR26DRAFT_878058 [Obelidium mucronatum]|nr:hypothetical protein BDR26DRAFT_878058 [Obelidium mucronatum]